MAYRTGERKPALPRLKEDNLEKFTKQVQICLRPKKKNYILHFYFTEIPSNISVKSTLAWIRELCSFLKT